MRFVIQILKYLPFALTALVLISISASAQAVGSVHYKIEIHPRADRTDVAVSVRFRPDEVQTTSVRLPTDYYGTPGIHRSVVSLAGTNGTRVIGTNDETERTVVPGKDGVASLRYVISYDPAEMDNYAFGPKVNSRYFHLAGCQWLLHIGDDETPRDVTVEMQKAPDGWNLYTSLSKDPQLSRTVASYFDLVPTAIGGGEDVRTFEVEGRPVSVFVQGDFDLSRDEIHRAAESIVRLQRNWFEDFDQPFFNVTINERKNVIAGTAVDNLFVCFVKPSATADELKLAIAHEMFHYWIPTRMRISIGENEKDIRHHWFSEGFTEYLSKKVLKDAGLITIERFLESVNSDIYDLADSPSGSLTYSQLAEKIDSGNFRQVDKKVSYYRGVLIAIKWESEMRSLGNGKSMNDFIRRLFKLMEKNRGELPEEELFGFASKYGVDAKSDFGDFVLEGLPIRLPNNALGSGIEGYEKIFPSFDTGLSLLETLITRIVTGVEVGGPAYKAGLRDGMELVTTGNSNRFSNAWESDKPLTMVVKVGGEEKSLSFFPHGKPIRFIQFRKKDGNGIL